MDELTVRRAVRETYADRAGSCCGSATSDSCGAEAAPSRATGSRDLGVGDTITAADPKPGEVLVDLGSGNGGDVIQAAGLVGPSGRAIGVDATPEMVYAAREASKGLANAEFRLGEIEHLPLDAGSADVVVSDCVINLSPDKPSVFREAFRVLKPGGRIVVSDLVTEKELPDEVRQAVSAWAACIAGAVPVSEYVRLMGEAGFVDVQATPTREYGMGVVSTLVRGRKP